VSVAAQREAEGAIASCVQNLADGRAKLQSRQTPQEAATMAKGQVKTDKKNKPKLSTKEKQEKKKAKESKK
jgi:hypothetical protein